MLSPGLIFGVIAVYFLVLIGISFITSKNSDDKSFFLANRQSPWYIVAFGMIGASLSGITFISVPGWVQGDMFSYMQMVFGYLAGYAVIALVLLPLYYRMNLTTIYGYLETRFGLVSYKTGAAYFLLSRIIGASFRLYLVALVLHEFVLGPVGLGFELTVILTILLIWIYTFRGGLNTIIWTDTLQTAFMLIAVIGSIVFIGSQMDLNIAGIVSSVKESDYSQIFFFEDGWSDKKNFFKRFFAGAFITIVMTGLDQDMMQKNLSCKTLEESQKNMTWFSIILVFVNLLFLGLGALLFMYAAQFNIDIPINELTGNARTDLLFPTIAIKHATPAIGILFVLGLVAAAYSSADSALTALTTSYCVDFLNFEKRELSDTKRRKLRNYVHVGFSVVLFLVIYAFYWINDDSVISDLFKAAGYTYGPLLGLYSFGYLTKRKIADKYAIIVCILAPVITYVINLNSEQLLWGYKFDFEHLILNGLLTFIGLLLISKKGQSDA